MQNKQLTTKKIAKGIYGFTYNGENFEIRNNEGLIGFTWNCLHVQSRKATETKPSKTYLTQDLVDYLLEDFFTDKDYWIIEVDENGNF